MASVVKNENKITKEISSKNMEVLISNEPIRRNESSELEYSDFYETGKVIDKRGNEIEGYTILLKLLNFKYEDGKGLKEYKFVTISEPDYYLDDAEVITPIFEPWKFYKFGGLVQRYLYFSPKKAFLEHDLQYWYPPECPEITSRSRK